MSEPSKPWPKPWPVEALAALGPCPPLALTVAMRERLRWLRAEQLADYQAGRPQIVDTIFITDQVVRLHAGGGHARYLGLDGRLHYSGYGEGRDVVVLDDPRDVASTIVRYAEEVGLPGLIDVLPVRPAGAVVCGVCRGSRWLPLEIMTGSNDEPLVCLRCKGLGWTLA